MNKEIAGTTLQRTIATLILEVISKIWTIKVFSLVDTSWDMTFRLFFQIGMLLVYSKLHTQSFKLITHYDSTHKLLVLIQPKIFVSIFPHNG